MKRLASTILVVSAALSGCAGFPALQGERELTSQEVKNLFADKTVESVNRSTGVTSFTYYFADGRVLQSRLWSTRAGKWHVKEDGRICLNFKKTKCRFVTNEKGVYYKVKGKKSDQKQRVVRYRNFYPGNLLAGKEQLLAKHTDFKP